MHIREFRPEGTKVEQPIIIYGAGVYGELCLRCLEKLGIHPQAFADRRRDLIEYLGIKVIQPDSILAYDNPVILLASSRYLKPIIAFLESQGIENYYCISELLKYSISENVLSAYALNARKNIGEYDQAIKSIKEDRLTLNNVDLVLTQYCNLRCRDCGSLIPYYHNPVHFEKYSVVKSFDRLMDQLDELKELRLLGGETFLYKDLDYIVKYYSENKKIKGIYIYTNAVILPSDEVLIRIVGNKTVIRISDYGRLSKNKCELIKKCMDLGIKYDVIDATTWRDMGEIKKRDYSDDQVRNIFQKCENAKCPSFCDGKLYICPRAAHMEKLGYFMNPANEVLDFSNNTTENTISRMDLEDFLSYRNYFEACRYCKGNNRWENLIPAAIQMGRK